jgi:ATP-binding cassette subfamily B protein
VRAAVAAITAEAAAQRAREKRKLLGGFRVVSPGSIECELVPARGNPVLAQRIVARLAAHPEVQRVAADPTTGVLSIRCSAYVPATAVHAWIIDVVTALLSERAPPRGLLERVARWLGDHPVASFALVPAPIPLFGLVGARTIGYVASGLLSLGLLSFQLYVRLRALTGSMSGNGDPRMEPLRRAMQRHRKKLIEAGSLRVVAVGVGLLPFAIIAVSINLVVGRGTAGLASLAASTPASALLLLGAAGLGLTALHSWLLYRSNVKTDMITQTIVHELRLEVYEHAQRLHLTYFEDARHGALLADLSTNLDNVEGIFMALRRSVHLASTIGLVSIALIAIVPQVAWLILLAIPLLLAITDRMQKLYFPVLQKWREEAAQLDGLLSGSLQGISTIKALAVEGEFLERIRAASASYRAHGQLVAWLSGAMAPILDLVVIGAVMVTVMAGGVLASGALTPGTFTSMVLLAQQLLVPMMDIGFIAVDMNNGFASYLRGVKLLGEPTEPDTGRPPPVTGLLSGDVVYRDVSFGYGPERAVCEGLDLHIPAGKTTAIVGATGSGKSTLAKLLLRFYEVQHGRIEIGGVDIRQLDLATLRSHIGMVSQDVFLFDGTVRENLSLGVGRLDDARLDDARLDDAVGAASADELVAMLPRGYDSRIGERGVKLSGGQRQRLAIARALLQDTPIYVFDEATSHIDNQTEALLQERLARVLRGRTVVIIAHRLSTVVLADRIHVLRDGRIVESGTHAELLALGGDYAALWRLQTRE